MMESKKYDEALKSLFSHPEMIVSLLKTFVSDRWIKDLDFSTLTAMKSDYISRQLNKRQSDLVWKIRANQEWLYLIFLLEFQSDEDAFMPVRILTYGGLIYEDLIKNEKTTLPKGKLPPIFPVVFYTGDTTWNAENEFRKCLSPHIPKILMDYQFESKYLLIDIGRMLLPKNIKKDTGLIYSIIELERSETLQEVNAAIQKTFERLKGKADSLKRAFLLYSIKALKVQEKFPEVKLEKLSEVSMLYEKADRIWEEFAYKNREEGREEGRQEERYEIQQKMLLKLLQKKFPQAFTSSMAARLAQASGDQLSQWLDQIIEERFTIDCLFETEKC